MIIIRFGKWDRCFYGKYVYRRLRIGKLWTPFCSRSNYKPEPMESNATDIQTAAIAMAEIDAIAREIIKERRERKAEYHAPGAAKRNKTRSDQTVPSRHSSRK